MITPRLNPVLESLRGARMHAELARIQLGVLRRGARPTMRFWALRWRQEVKEHGPGEASEALLDMAVGWREVAR